jgi:hypothetical protein
MSPSLSTLSLTSLSPSLSPLSRPLAPSPLSSLALSLSLHQGEATGLETKAARSRLPLPSACLNRVLSWTWRSTAYFADHILTYWILAQAIHTRAPHCRSRLAYGIWTALRHIALQWRVQCTDQPTGCRGSGLWFPSGRGPPGLQSPCA